MSIRTVEQSVPSGSNFTGAAPTVAPAPVVGSNLEISPIEGGDGAGEFDFEQDRPTMIHQIMVRLSGQTTFTIDVVDRNGVEMRLVALTNDAFFHSGLNTSDHLSNFILLAGEKLRLRTTGTTTQDIIARVSVDQYRS